MKIFLAFPLLLALAAIADAGCQVRQRFVAVPVAQAILVPAYGGSYAPPQQQNDDVLRRLVEVLERLESRLDAPAGGHSVESITRQSCAKCHTEGQNPKAGFVLFDRESKLAELSLGDKKLIALRITSKDPAQRMPPEIGLSAGIQAALMQALSK